MGMARRPVARTESSVWWVSPRATSATSAPASASATAIAAPRPRDAPVTIAVFPSILKRSRTLNDHSEASQFEAEVRPRVEQRNVLRQTAEQVAIVRQQAAAHLVAED